jgi:hypothetical protein
MGWLEARARILSQVVSLERSSTNKISRKEPVHLAISETSGTMFSSSFKVGIMIETELENGFVIRNAQTFNAQTAFGKNLARQAFNVQSLDFYNSQSSASAAVVQNKNARDQR